MKEMRRKERKVTDPNKIQECLKDSACLHVGFYDKTEEEVYILPVNFGYLIDQEHYTLYFHGAKEGRKAELAKESPSVGFEMETHLASVTAPVACGHSELFLSIVGNGKLSIVDDIEEKKLALNSIMFKETGKDDWEYPEAALQATAVYKIDVKQLSCKAHE